MQVIATHFAILRGLLSNAAMFPLPQTISTNSIELAVYEQGSGPAVIFVHGFPELAFSWRHQLPAFAAAGFRAIAPDMRGYGQSAKPADVKSYHISELIKDLLGMLDALDIESASFVGHDWGALVLWHMAMLAPERMERLVALNIPHFPRSPVDPIDVFRAKFGDDFYIVNFQDSNEADRLFAKDPAHFLNMMMRRNQISRADFERLPDTMKSLSLLQVAKRGESGGEALLTPAELEYFSSAFEKGGFTGPINWYRNWSDNWKSLQGIDQAIDLPTLFIGAVDDIIIAPEHIEAMRPLVADLTIEMLEPCGHWTQQERPDDVNRIILNWLHG